MTKDGFTFLVMGFTGKEAAMFKEMYIKAFNYLLESVKERKELKGSLKAMSAAVLTAHKEPKPYHFSNEANLICKLVTGAKVKDVKEDYNVSEDGDIRDALTNSQKKLLDKLQQMNTGLILIGMDYQERKERLIEYCKRIQEQEASQKQEA